MMKFDTGAERGVQYRIRIKRHVRLARLLAVGLGAAAFVVGSAGMAAAHVTVSPTEAAAGSYTVLTFAVPHGCDGSATTEVAIQIPQPTPTLTPTVNPGWDVEKVMVELDEPIVDSHGNELTERVDQVVYTAKTPLPDGLRDTFELSIRMPDTPGETLAFPVVQTCEEGESAWVQLAADGQDPSELDEPAPLVAVAEVGDTEESTGQTLSEESQDPANKPAASDQEPVAASSDGDGSTDNLAIAGLGAGLLGVVVGGAALARTRRRA